MYILDGDKKMREKNKFTDVWSHKQREKRRRWHAFEKWNDASREEICFRALSPQRGAGRWDLRVSLLNVFGQLDRRSKAIEIVLNENEWEKRRWKTKTNLFLFALQRVFVAFEQSDRSSVDRSLFVSQGRGDAFGRGFIQMMHVAQMSGQITQLHCRLARRVRNSFLMRQNSVVVAQRTRNVRRFVQHLFVGPKENPLATIFVLHHRFD